MAQHIVKLTRKGSTVTLIIDKYVCAFDIEFMDRAQIYEAIKWEAITANVVLSEETVIRLTQEASFPA